MQSGLQALERERKFYWSLMVFGLLVLMRAFDMVSDASFEALAQTLIIAFMAGNVGEHFAKREPK